MRTVNTLFKQKIDYAIMNYNKLIFVFNTQTTQREALAWIDEMYWFHPGAGKDMKERMASLFGGGKGKKEEKPKL